MNLLKLVAVTALTSVLSISVQADEQKTKRELKNNMVLKTNILPKSANSLEGALSEGVFYGRLRINTFRWDWKNESSSTKDNKALGLGGSLLYRTAQFQGVSGMVGFYYTSSPFSQFRQDLTEIRYAKAGKDTFSRDQLKNDGSWSYAVLAQANLQYKASKTTFKVGRQIFESFLTKSNDTKMIPNTFEGYTIDMREISKTRIRTAYFTAQKLRDHTEFHDVITFKDASGDSWGNNDDSAIHKGLSYANFKAAGADVKHDLIVVDVKNKSVKNLKLNVTYGAVPDVVSSITGELNYKIALLAGYSLTPGVRYMKQMDNGGGKIGGANLKGNFGLDKGVITNNLGYKDVHNLGSSLWMARLVLKKGPLKAKIGYSAVADDADIVAPWRGFPTGGYTRAMGQYNWYANTKTWNVEANYDFGKAGLIPGFSAMARYAIQNFDEAKQAAGVQADSKILHMDFRENFENGLYAKVRVGLVSADSRANGVEKDSYNEYRFELNYLF